MHVRAQLHEGLSAEDLAEIERRQAQIAAGDVGVVLDPEDEAEHLAGCAEIEEHDRRGELVPAEDYLRRSREARALSRQRRAG